MQSQRRQRPNIRVAIEKILSVRRHGNAMRARLFRQTREAGSVRVNAIQVSFYRRLLERSEINPTIFFIDADDRLAHPERYATRACERPLSLSHLIFERDVHAIAIQMHEAVSFGWPKKVLPVVEEIQVVRHVHPTGIRLGEQTCSTPGFAIGNIKRQLRLKTRHGFQTQAPAIRQPPRAHDVFKRFVVDLNPGGAVVSELGDAESQSWIGAAGARVSLANDTRGERNKVDEVAEVHGLIV